MRVALEVLPSVRVDACDLVPPGKLAIDSPPNSEKGKEMEIVVLLVTEATETSEAMAHVSYSGGKCVVPAGRIASEAGVPVAELPGRRFTASMGVGGELHDFRLIDDPRI